VVASDSESGPIPLDGGLGSWRIPPIRPMEPNLLFRGLGRSRSYTRVVPPGYRNAYTFKLNDLVRPPSLSDYKGKNSFLITSNSGNELTDMYIIPAKDRDLKRLAIADQISTHIRKGTLSVVFQIPTKLFHNGAKTWYFFFIVTTIQLIQSNVSSKTIMYAV